MPRRNWLYIAGCFTTSASLVLWDEAWVKWLVFAALVLIWTWGVLLSQEGARFRGG
jgi:hypothetical protein